MAGVTNRGKFLIFNSYFRNIGTVPGFYVALVTSATIPTADTNFLSSLTEIPSGTGYTTGGELLNRNSTDFDSLLELDAGTSAAQIQAKDVVWTAAGGNLPPTGQGAHFAVLTTSSLWPINGREVIAYWDLVSDRTISDTQTLTLQNLQINALES